MSETAATDAAVAAPVAEPQVTPAPETTEAQQAPEVRKPEDSGSQPKSRHDLRSGAYRRAAERFEEPAAPEGAAEVSSEGADGEAPIKTTEKGTHHRKDGTFASKQEVEAAASPDAAVAEEAKTERAETPEGFVRIELPEGHDWRREVPDSFVEVPAHVEKLFRTAVNNVTRRAEVEAKESELYLLRAQLHAMQNGRVFNQNDPKIQHALKDVENTYPELAEALKYGLDAMPQAEIQNQATALREEASYGSVVQWTKDPQQTQRFAVWANQPGTFADGSPAPNRFVAEAQQVGMEYADEIRAHNQRNPHAPRVMDTAEFGNRLARKYLADPDVAHLRIAYETSKREAALREELEAKVRAELEEQRAKEEAGREVQDRHRTVRSIGAIATAGQKNGQRSFNPPSPDEQIAELSPSDRKRALRERAVARASGRSAN